MNRLALLTCATLTFSMFQTSRGEHAEKKTNAVSNAEIVFVDFNQIATQAKVAGDLMKALEKELQERAQAIQSMYASFEKKRLDFEKSRTALSTEAMDERKKELMQLEHKVRIEEASFQEFAQRRRQQVEQELFEDVLRIVRAYAQKHNVTGIANAAMMLYVDPKYVITDEIVDQMNKEYEAKRAKPASAAASDKK